MLRVKASHVTDMHVEGSLKADIMALTRDTMCYLETSTVVT